MMIVYAHLFKCLQPIVIIVSTLIIGDPCKSMDYSIEFSFLLRDVSSSIDFESSTIIRIETTIVIEERFRSFHRL